MKGPFNFIGRTYSINKFQFLVGSFESEIMFSMDIKLVKRILVFACLIFFIFIYIKFFHNKPEEKMSMYSFSQLNVTGSTFDVLKVDKQHIQDIYFYYKDQHGKKFSTIGGLKHSIEKQGKNLAFATNAGIFSTSYEPLGLYIENGKVVSKVNTSTGEGNFYLKPNGIFLIQNNQAKIIQTKDYVSEKDVLFATQSGPLLVIDRQINTAFDIHSQNKNIRSGVGIDKDGNLIFAISNTPVTFYEFAALFKEQLNCSHALYLDGSISEMYVQEKRENTKEQFSVLIGMVEG